MIRRLTVTFATLGLIAIAVIGGLQSPLPAVDAQTTIDELETGLREDFNAVFSAQAPTTADGAVGVQSIQASESVGPFPRTALYGGPNSSGWPMVGVLSDNRPGWSEPLNASVMNAYARFPHVIIPVMPPADMRPDILTGLRERNSSIRIHAYIHGGATWCPQDQSGNNSYPANTSYRDIYLATNGGDPSCTTTSDRFLWAQDGVRVDLPPHSMGINFNLAYRVQNPDLSYTYDVAEDLAEAMYEYGRAGRNWNGIFLDVFCPNILWMETPGHLFDYARAGYGNDNANPANRTAFDVGWNNGHQRLVERLRELAVADGQPNYPISGNCGQAPSRLHTAMNGWMRENYPYQNAYAGTASFYSNNLAWPWGLLHQDWNFLSPQYNYIFTAANWSGGNTNNPSDEQYNAANQRKMRFGLGSTAMGNGWHAFHESSGDTSRGHWYNWWYDEYGVQTNVTQSHPDFGKAMNGPQYSGWLGQPLGPAYQHLSTAHANTANLLSGNTGFETPGGSPGTVPHWSLTVFSGAAATVERDSTTAAEGGAAVKVTVTTATPSSAYFVNLLHSSTFSVSAYQQYSISFKAKASAALPVSLTFTGGASGAFQTFRVDQEWRQYQVVVQALNTVSAAGMRFELGQAQGEYWFDDVKVQNVVTSVWRRDFERGTVLLNPAATPQTIDLEKPYRKISGTVNPAFNNGAQISSVTLAGTNSQNGIGDAIFLLNLDLTPPANTNDLRAP